MSNGKADIICDDLRHFVASLYVVRVDLESSLQNPFRGSLLPPKIYPRIEYPDET
jgi:hypothetical protein